jgi:hypothetical protein
MAHGSATEVKDKWLARLGQAQQEMQAGVARVTVSPGQSAVAKKQKWINSMADPITQDKWARNTGSVSLESWRASMVDYGIARVQQGAQAKAGKFEKAMDSLLPYIDQGRNLVRQMPDDNYAAREQRALAMMRHMRAYKRPSS